MFCSLWVTYWQVPDPAVVIYIGCVLFPPLVCILKVQCVGLSGMEQWGCRLQPSEYPLSMVATMNVNKT